MNPGAEAYDPDGPSGPREPVVNQWRFMFLEDNSIPGVPFFVEYNFPPNSRRAAPEHPNGATRISSVWILVNNLAAARAAYRRAHFAEKESVTLPHLGAEGILLDAGEGEILLLAPHSTSPLAMQLQRRGDHVVGMSIEVSNLGAAEQLIEERLEQDLARHQGRFGTSFLVPSLEPLGVLLEFHE